MVERDHPRAAGHRNPGVHIELMAATFSFVHLTSSRNPRN
jgi:hypothetical protein